ncbi:MAG: O-antigen ligase family protein [Hyphomonadaceae bacterium]|nr:O-antigen ligase family protein [Hyphomonadaceae bacterium]
MTTANTSTLGAPPIESPAGFQPEQPRSLLSYARHADPFVMFIWAVSTTLPVGFLAPLRYLAAAYFAGCLILFARQTMPSVARSWPLFLLPILCTISALWAPSMEEALRKGFSLALTGAVAIYAGTRIPGRKILIAYFAAEMIAALMSLGNNSIDQGAWTGIFGQKNFFAVNMFILYVASLGVALDRENGRWIRRLACATIPLALFMVLMAKSGTTTVLSLVTTIAMVGHSLVWRPAAHIPKARLLIVMVFAVIVLAAVYVFIGILQLDLMEEVLGALGKDSTLTGRTMLWDIAQRNMDEHPWTGLGANGYWRAERGMANSIQQMLQGNERFSGFSFHNSYYENGSNYGYPGYWATVFLAVWTCSSAALTWLRNQTSNNMAFLVLALMVVLRSTSEADLSGEFGGTVVLLFIAASRKENLSKKHLTPSPTAPPFPPRPAGA